AELLAGAGFDWLLIDGEHAPNNVQTVLTQLQAIAPYPSQPVVRPSWNDPVQIKQPARRRRANAADYRWCRMPMKRETP
ncbi:2,4-dihydroxyhept-2-ene-1,7-dioic acid aldolase, partial [Salmonella enterica subsp. enterica serovar Enteritidis str. 50-5646]